MVQIIIIMKIKDLFDDRLVAILDKYSDNQDSAGSALLRLINNSERDEIIIPFLGMQGMGKSTLINGVLGENILPNDVDETTCVPVEVKYGTDECSKVHFSDGQSTVIIHTREELNEYVDNNYNPANEKKVSYVELFRNHPMLQSGIVIVDLPGVGSMTKENEETTKRYVENLCTAVFVIPTVPTIRKTEAIFIKGLWSQFNKAIFVQNDWGESKAEKEESLDFNMKVLKKIADELHIPYNGEITVINAYNAVLGAVQHDKPFVDRSNIKSLYDKILLFSSTWKGEKEELIKVRTLMCIEYAKGRLLNIISALHKTKEEIQADNERKKQCFLDGTKKLSEKVDEVKQYLHKTDMSFKAETIAKAKECAGLIRAGMYERIKNGIYDGEQLSTAFKDVQKDETDRFLQFAVDAFVAIKIEVESKFRELNQIKVDADKNLHYISCDQIESVKWEKAANVILSLTGAGVSALKAGAIAAPLIKLLGLSLSGGPAMAVTVAVGIVVFGVFAAARGGIKKLVQKDRGKVAKKHIDPLIDEIEKNLIKEMENKRQSFFSSCDKELDKILSNRDKEYRELEASLTVTYDNSQEEELSKELNYITNKENELKYV